MRFRALGVATVALTCSCSQTGANDAGTDGASADMRALPDAAQADAGRDPDGGCARAVATFLDGFAPARVVYIAPTGVRRSSA